MFVASLPLDRAAALLKKAFAGLNSDQVVRSDIVIALLAALARLAEATNEIVRSILDRGLVEHRVELIANLRARRDQVAVVPARVQARPEFLNAVGGRGGAQPVVETSCRRADG